MTTDEKTDLLIREFNLAWQAECATYGLNPAQAMSLWRWMQQRLLADGERLFEQTEPERVLN